MVSWMYYILILSLNQLTIWIDDKCLGSPTCSEKDALYEKGRPSFDGDKAAVAPRRMSLLKSVLGLKLPKRKYKFFIQRLRLT